MSAPLIGGSAFDSAGHYDERAALAHDQEQLAMTAPSAPLAPCPFCGSTAISLDTRWAVCTQCDAEGPTADSRATDIPAAAIAAWNTRAAATVDAELVAACKAAVNYFDQTLMRDSVLYMMLTEALARAALPTAANGEPISGQPGAAVQAGGALGASGSSTVQD